MKNQLILATLTLFLALTICSVATAAESIDNSTYSTTLGQATDQNSFVASSNSNETNSNPENLTNDDRTSITSTLALDPGVSNISQGTLPDPQIWRNGVYVDTYATIQAAIDAAQSGDTIMLEDGATFYEYGFLINKDLTFNVLNGGHATIDAQFHEIFYIISGVTVNLYNLTLQNSLNFGAVDGGAITNEGTLNIAECTFTNNSADWGGSISNWNYLTVIGSTFTSNMAINGGGAINNYYGTLTVIGCTFTNNVADWGDGGAIYNHDTLNITDSNFTTNNAYNQGGAICNDSGTILNITNTTFAENYAYGNGGAISNDSGTILNITNTTFTGNDASSFGGAIYNYYGNYYDTLNITDSNFTSNTASNGGAIYNDSGIFNITTTTFTNNTASTNRGSVISTYTGLILLNFNRIIGNTNPAVTSWGRLIDATLNWWGSNESPVGEVSVNVNYDPWIFLTVTADPNSINIGETSTVTADLMHDSTYDPANPDASYHDPADGHVPEVLLTLELNPDWGTLTYNPGSGWSINGNYTADGLVPIPPSVRVYANADDEHIVYTDITIKSLNEPPVLDPIGNKSADENQELEFTINATDPEGNILIYSANNLPQGATFDPGTRTFTWTPTYDQTGLYTVTFTVSDEELTDSEDVSITVNNMNRPPVLNNIGPKTVNENENLQFTVTGNDPDGDSITYAASNLPNGVTFNNGVFNWTPDYTQSGLYTVTFTVSDGSLTNSEEVHITVKNVNRPPSASISDSYFVNLPITMRVAGISGNRITLEIVQEGFVITSASLIKETGFLKDQEISLSAKIDLSKPFSGRLLFEAGPSGWGANPVWLIIDGKKTLITTFVAIPYLSFTKKQTRNLQLKELFTLVGKEITFNATANDPDINNITFTWKFGDNPKPKIQTHTSDGVNTITDTATHTYTIKGTYTINLKVRDDEGAEVTKTKTIKIW